MKIPLPECQSRIEQLQVLEQNNPGLATATNRDHAQLHHMTAFLLHRQYVNHVQIKSVIMSNSGEQIEIAKHSAMSYLRSSV